MLRVRLPSGGDKYTLSDEQVVGCPSPPFHRPLRFLLFPCATLLIEWQWSMGLQQRPPSGKQSSKRRPGNRPCDDRGGRHEKKRDERIGCLVNSPVRIRVPPCRPLSQHGPKRRDGESGKRPHGPNAGAVDGWAQRQRPAEMARRAFLELAKDRVLPCPSAQSYGV